MAQEKDIITKDVLKNLARDFSKYLLKIPVYHDIELIDKEFTRVEKREADLLFKNGNMIVHIEIQNNNHLSMHKRMLRYYSDIYFDFDDYKISQYVIYMGKSKCSMVYNIKNDELDYHYNLIDMSDIPCEEFLNSDNPSAITLAILCDFKNKDKQLVVNTILKKLKSLCNDDLEFRNHLKMVEVLSTNRNLEDFVKKGEKDMLVVDLEKLPSFELGFEKGIENGKKEGKLKGQLEEKRAIAISLLEILDDKTISQRVGLSLQEVQKLRERS